MSAPRPLSDLERKTPLLQFFRLDDIADDICLQAERMYLCLAEYIVALPTKNAESTVALRELMNSRTAMLRSLAMITPA